MGDLNISSFRLSVAIYSEETRRLIKYEEIYLQRTIEV